MSKNNEVKEHVEIKIIKRLIEKLESLEELTICEDYHDDNRKKCIICGCEGGHDSDCFWTDFLLYKKYIESQLGDEVGIITSKGWED